MKKLKFLVMISVFAALTFGVTANLCAAAAEIPIAAITATADQADKGNVVENLIDGNPETRWAGNTTDRQVGDVYVLADVGNTKMISGVGFSQFKGDERVMSFQIHVSKDGTNFTKVYEGETSGKTLDIQRFNFTPVEARYLKFVPVQIKIVADGTFNPWASLFEFKVYGSDVQASVPTSNNPKTGDFGVITYALLGATSIGGLLLNNKKRYK